MYRLKYYSLSKKDQYHLKEEFYSTSYGKEINARLKRLLIIGILCLFFSIYLFFSQKNIYDLITAIMLTLAGLIFIIGSIRLRTIKLNNYLIKKK